MSMEHWWNDTDRRNLITDKQRVPMPFILSPIPNALAWDRTVSPRSDVRHSMAPKCLDGNAEGMVEMRVAEKTLVPKFGMKEIFESHTHTRNIIILKCIFLEIIL